jgi:hypothetical protein
MAHKYFRQQNMSIGDQILAMKRLFPSFRYSFVRGIANWTGDLQPNVLCDRYRVKISYNQNRNPFVNVINPKLTKREGSKSIPHVYPEDRLCLFHPRKSEWNHTMLIAETIIPWTSLWLFYYETWQATGEWLGGGEHPIPKKSKNRGIK